MRFYGIGQMSQNEKNNILNKHQEVYMGYKKVHTPINEPQSLFVQDFANDKSGITVNGDGEVSEYNNKIYMKESKEKICSECGSVMNEDMCEQCGSEMEEDIYDVEDLNSDNEFDYVEEDVEFEQMESAFSEDLDEIEGPLYSEVKPAYNFKSEGPMYADGPYGGMREELEEVDLDKLMKGKKYKFKPHKHYEDTLEYDDFHEYPTGTPMYGFKGEKDSWHAMGPDFVEKYLHDIDETEEFDLEDEGETDTAFTKMKRGHKPVDIDWEDIDTVWNKMKRGHEPEDVDFEEIDSDIKESFLVQKNKINEMFNRFKKYN